MASEAMELLEAIRAERARQKAELRAFVRSANSRPSKDLNGKADYWLSVCLDDEFQARHTKRDKRMEHAPFAIANARGDGWKGVDQGANTLQKVDAIRDEHRIHYVETR